MNPLKTQAEEITTKTVALRMLKAMSQEITADEAVIRYARRALALYKDRARVKAERIARLYTPRITKGLSKKTIALVENLRAVDLTPKHAPKHVRKHVRKAAKAA